MRERESRDDKLIDGLIAGEADPKSKASQTRIHNNM